MARITVEDCTKIIPNVFELCILASARATNIASGAYTSFDLKKEKASVIALREIAEDKLDLKEIERLVVQNIKTNMGYNSEPLINEYTAPSPAEGSYKTIEEEISQTEESSVYEDIE